MKLFTSTSLASIAALIATTSADNNAVVNTNCGADVSACRDLVNQLPGGSWSVQKNYSYDWEGCYMIYTPGVWGADPTTTLDSIKALLASTLVNIEGNVQAVVAPSGGGNVCIGNSKASDCCGFAYASTQCGSCGKGAEPLNCYANESGGTSSNCYT